MLLVAAASTPAVAQRIDPGRPATLVVGRSKAPSPAERVDGARRGLSPFSLPEGTLHVTWRRTVAPTIEHAPLVTEDGAILVFTGRGDLVELDADGTERRRVGVGVGPVGPGAILSDGTVVAMTTAGEAVGIARGAIRFRTRVSESAAGTPQRDRGVLVKVAPLALEDGGVIVASSSGPAAAPVASEIAALDAEGRVRARATLPAPIAWPLVATRSGVACITAEGAVFTWAPGQAPVRAGSFAGALDGGAAARAPHTLVAVVDARRLVALDLDPMDARVLATTARGALLGPPSVRGSEVHVMEVAPPQLLLQTVDASGTTSSRSLSLTPVGIDADGGIAGARLPVHSSTLVDAAGRVAFAGPDGHVGVVSGTASTELGEVVCARGAPPQGGPAAMFPNPRPGGRSGSTARPSAGFAGLVPARPNAFLVACEAGVLLEVAGASPPPSPSP
jgi:hypothetical protein